jgi:hypothetical protein
MINYVKHCPLFHRKQYVLETDTSVLEQEGILVGVPEDLLHCSKVSLCVHFGNMKRVREAIELSPASHRAAVAIRILFLPFLMTLPMPGRLTSWTAGTFSAS